MMVEKTEKRDVLVQVVITKSDLRKLQKAVYRVPGLSRRTLSTLIYSEMILPYLKKLENDPAFRDEDIAPE
ncbi:MAG: hypothetical protein D6706_20115 [Chloroflexi bacterium]|nr:MAG: hypothetical protein D6706_20115 [Chloroflexota bacterium]